MYLASWPFRLSASGRNQYPSIHPSDHLLARRPCLLPLQSCASSSRESVISVHRQIIPSTAQGINDADADKVTLGGERHEERASSSWERDFPF